MNIKIYLIKSIKKQKNYINYKKKILPRKATKWEKRATTTTKETLNNNKENGLKFTSTPKRNNIELKSIIQNYICRLQLAEFFQNKEANDSEENLFREQSIFILYRNRDRNLDHQMEVLNKLNFQEMGTKSKRNNM